MMKRALVTGMALLSLALAPPANAQTSPITMDLRNSAGQSVGSATLTPVPGGVEVRVQARGLPPGLHGIHFHEFGRCDGPDFMSAGDHFNPTGRQHGLRNPAGPHAGDLPNLEVVANGIASFTATINRLTLGSGPTSLNDADGTALVIHANPDDDLSDPSGNSGGRIACGVVPRGSTAAAAPGPAPVRAAAPAQLPRTGLVGPGLAPLGLTLGVLLLGLGVTLRRRGR